MRRMLLAGGRAAGVVAVTAALFVPLLVMGGTALAHTGFGVSEFEYGGSSQYQYGNPSGFQYKVRICHRTHSKKHPWVTISISSRAWPAHKRHGDRPLPCGASALKKGKKKGDAAVKVFGKSSLKHGKSGEHGKSGQHGKSNESNQHGKSNKGKKGHGDS